MWGYWGATSPEKREVEQEQVRAIFAILEDWFQALEDGTAGHRLPDPTFTSPSGRPAITETLVEEFINELDREIDTDAFGVQGKKYKADASCEFHRLAYPQRVALIQHLMGALLTEHEVVHRAESLHPEATPSAELEVA